MNHRGRVIGTIADELGIDLEIVADVHRCLIDFDKPDAGLPPLAGISNIILALCVRLYGGSPQRASNTARENPALAAALLDAMQNGRDWRYDHRPQTDAVVVATTISGRSLHRIYTTIAALDQSGCTEAAVRVADEHHEHDPSRAATIVDELRKGAA